MVARPDPPTEIASLPVVAKSPDCSRRRYRRWLHFGPVDEKWYLGMRKANVRNTRTFPRLGGQQASPMMVSISGNRPPCGMTSRRRTVLDITCLNRENCK